MSIILRFIGKVFLFLVVVWYSFKWTEKVTFWVYRVLYSMTN